MSGKAFLVGAGPGRADLITVRGLTILRQAEIVLYDRLIAPDLLTEAPAAAQRIFVGKGPDRHVMRQEEINALLVELVRAGRFVVRLKGGDPCVFGHAGEEAAALAGAGLPFEIVPGVSSAIAVPTYAGVPVTQRGLSTAFAVVTGHEAPGKATTTTDWEALARIPTLIVLMALKRLEPICTMLIAAGRDPSTPALIISRGATDQQRTLAGTLADLPERHARQPLPTPAILVVGAVAALAETLAWFVADGTAAGHIAWEED
jgi:uroporphyrin-III C-methyltransferase